MILVFQKYHFNFTAGDAKLCWISIFTFSSPILFILFLCFLGNFYPVHFMLLARDWGNFYSSKSKSERAALCLQLLFLVPLDYRFYATATSLLLLLTPLLSVLLSLLVICTKYSRPGSKCGCTSRPSTSCYSPKSSSPASILNSMCTFSAKSNEIFAACD